MNKIEIKINGETLDIYKDVNIEIDDSVKNLYEVDSALTQFTNSFDVPATRNNNKILAMYHNYIITGGQAVTNYNYYQPAVLQVGGVELMRGYVELMGSSFKNGVLESYELTFFSNIIEVKNRLKAGNGDDLMLSDLEYDPKYNHIKTPDNVVNSHDVSNMDGYYYPLINSTGFKWDAAKLDSGLATADLRPAIPVDAVFEAIYKATGLQFLMFGVKSNLFIWCPLERDADDYNAIEDYIDLTSGYDQYIDIENDEITVTSGYGAVTIRIDTTMSSQTESYSVKMLDVENNNGVINLGSATGDSTFSHTFSPAQDGKYKIILDSSSQLSSTIIGTYYIQGGSFHFTGNGETSLADSDIRYKLPSISVKDFISGMIKMYNLVIVDSSKYDIHYPEAIMLIDTWDKFMMAGKKEDLTKYIDASDIQIELGKFPYSVSLQYGEPDAYDAKEYKELNGHYYGDMKSVTKGLGEDYEVEVPFENLMWKRTDGSHIWADSQEPYADITDGEIKGITDKVMLMYREVHISDDIDFTDSVANTDGRWIFNSTDGETALTFGDDQSTAYNLDPNYPTYGAKSLFNRFYKTMFNTILQHNVRRYSVKCFLPFPLYSKLKLNSIIQVKDDYYRLESITYNIADNSTSLVLNTNVYSLSDADTQPPVIGVLTLGTITDGSVQLTWTAATDNVTVQKYNIFRDGVLYEVVDGTILEYYDTGIVGGDVHDYYITATDNEFNESTPSNTVTANVPVDITPPTDVTVSEIGKTTTSISVSWTASTDESGIKEYRIFVGGSLNKTVAGNVTSTVISGLTSNTLYSIYVEPVDNYDNTGGSNTIDVTTVSETLPEITSDPYWILDKGDCDDYQITATNSPDIFSATGVPIGFTFDELTGLISGCANDSGAFYIQLKASNDGGATWGDTMILELEVLGTLI